jgi:hypothetical protein
MKIFTSLKKSCFGSLKKFLFSVCKHLVLFNFLYLKKTVFRLLKLKKQPKTIKYSLFLKKFFTHFSGLTNIFQCPV